MTERAGPKVETLTIRIPMRLQRRSGRKLIITPEGAEMPAPKRRRDEDIVKALARTAGEARSRAGRRGGSPILRSRRGDGLTVA